MLHRTHETVSGEEKRRCSKCVNLETHTYWNYKGVSESDNISNLDDLVTEEGTQGPDSK